MGNSQPKKMGKVNKTQVDMASLKVKIHLEMMRDRKNNQIIKGEKELVQKIKANSRNKTQQILVAQRVISGLKYAKACNMLMAYAVSLRGQAQFIADNVTNQQRIQPFLMQIYSILYAADRLGLSSLNEFKAIMKSLNDPVNQTKYVNPQIIELLSPTISPQDLNTYMVQMAERNNLTLQEINIIGHRFTKDYQEIPQVPSQYQKMSFEEMQRKLAQELQRGNTGGNKNYNQPTNPNINPNQGYPNQYNQSPYGQNQSPYGQNQNPYGQNQGPYGSNQNPYGGYNNPNQNQGGFNPTSKPSNQPGYIQDSSHQPSNISGGSNPYGFTEDDIYTPKQIPKDKNPMKNPINESSLNIKGIEDIDYYPEIDPIGKPNIPIVPVVPYVPIVPVSIDPNFEKLCQAIKKGL